MVHTVINEDNINEVEVIREDLRLILDKALEYDSTLGMCVEMLLSVVIHQLDDIETAVNSGRLGDVKGTHLRLNVDCNTKLRIMLPGDHSIDVNVTNSDASFIGRKTINNIK